MEGHCTPHSEEVDEVFCKQLKEFSRPQTLVLYSVIYTHSYNHNTTVHIHITCFLPSNMYCVSSRNVV